MKRIFAALLLLAAAGASLALVPGGSVEFLDQRIAEIDGSLLRIKVDLAEGRVPDAQKADFATLQRSLENEKALLQDRKAVLLRLEPQSQSQPLADTADSAPATAAASASPAAPASAAPANPMLPVSSPKPRVPDAVCQQRLSGYVGLEFAVLPEGKVADVKVTASEPKGAFDAAAVEAVSARTYSARPLPVKMKEKMFLSFADCRSEQLRTAEADGSAPAQDCPAIAAAARAVSAPFDPIESGRAVLAGGAQVYSAPDARCPVAGKKLKAGTPLMARVEYREFSLVANPKGGDEGWVRSNSLKDTAP